MLFEFHSCELSHVGPGGGVRYVVGTANNVSPQPHYLLPLYELESCQRATGQYGKGVSHMVEPQNILPYVPESREKKFKELTETT